MQSSWLLHDRSINELYESDFEKISVELHEGASADGLREKYESKTAKIRRIYMKYFKDQTVKKKQAAGSNK